jgi:hypothetical protein
MSDLDSSAVALLWPILQVVGMVAGVLVSVIGGCWIGFRWLRDQIRSTAQELIVPLVERIVLLEHSTEAAHRRIDEWLGTRR